MITTGIRFQVPGLGHRVSGSGIQVRAQVPGLNPYLHPHPYLQPRPETRDEFPTANRFQLTCAALIALGRAVFAITAVRNRRSAVVGS